MPNSNILFVYNYGKMCRTCLSEGELKGLYEKYAENICPAEMIMSISCMQITENDGLPSQICTNCEHQLIYAYNFVQRSIANEAKLRSCLKEFEIKIKEQVAAKSTEDDRKNLEIPKKECAPNFEQIFVMDPGENEIKIEENQIDNSLEILEIKEENDATVDNTDNNFDNSVFDPRIQQESNDSNQKTVKNQCHICFEAFPTYKLLKVHYKEVKHPGYSYRKEACKICKKIVGRMSDHMRVHTMERPYRCDICDAHFSQSSSRRRHMRSHANVRPHKCNECGKSFTRLEFLRNHQRCHSGSFICKYCNKEFSQMNLFKSHICVKRKGLDKCMNRVKNHKCSECQRAFATKAILKTHMRIHGEKQFLCSDCGRSFVSKNLLQCHSTIHTGLRPFTCETCGKTFSQFSSLYTHRATHSESKAFVCEICKRGFKLKSHYRRHQRTHSGDRPYACSVCGKTFALNGNLTVHMRTHTGETPYLCPVCGKGFHDSSSMKKHKKGHGEQTQAD